MAMAETQASILSAMDITKLWPQWRFPIDFCPGIFACNDNPIPGTPVYSSKTQTGLQAQLLLCSSVGILCLLLFCLLRVRWGTMYSPRLRMSKHAPEHLPDTFFGWILPLLKTSNSVVLEKVGLDAVVMLQFLMMGFKLFTLCGFFGVIVLYPISKMGGDLTDPIDPEPGNPDNSTQPDSLLGLDLSGYSPAFLWVYLFFTYLFCFATFYFTFMNYRDYVYIRREYLLRIGKTIPAKTILVTGIPPNLRSDRKLAEYFETLGIGVVDSVHIIRHVSRLLEFIKERAQYLRRLETAYTDFWGNPCYDPTYDPDRLLREAERDQSLHALDWTTTGTEGLPTHSKDRERPLVRDGFMGLIGNEVDSIKFHTEKFNEIDEMVLKARKHGRFLPTSVGFVTYEDSISASIASQVLISSTPFRLRAHLAPEPRDVLWENIAMHGRERVIRKGMIWFILLFLVFFWVIPISYFSALTSENSLRNYFPWLMKLAEKNKLLRQIIQGFLPTLGVNIFMAFLPLILNGLSVVEGFATRSEAEESTFSKHFFFLLFNVLLVFTISSALFKALTEMIEDPTKISQILATRLPQVAPFFVNYTVMQGMMLLPIQLLQIGPIIVQLLQSAFFCKTPRDYAEVLAPRMYNYGSGYPVPVFMFVVLLVYSTISPLILLFGAVYYGLAYLVFKYQLLYVYFHPYEVAGRMWPLVFSRIIVGLLLFQLTSSGLFVLRHAYPLAALCLPLILITIAFKIGMEAAYKKNTQFLPLQLLAERFGPMASTVADPPNSNPPERSIHPTSHDTTGEVANESPQLENVLDNGLGGSEAAQLDAALDQGTRSEIGHEIDEHMSHTARDVLEHDDSNNDPAMKPLRRRRTVLDEDDYTAEPRQYTDFKEPPMTLLDGILNTGMKQYGHPALLGVLPQLWLPIKAGHTNNQGVCYGSKPGSGRYVASNSRSIHDNGERQPLLGTPPINIREPPRDIPNGRVEDSETDDDFEVGTYYHHPERRHSRTLSKNYGAARSHH
ncbi:hypothetical protein CLU79DRAFT_740969 [Phycomyces nitens]|nr:hypothetical protein CLU79DRAFT_740969 [Phycomyces nitens]